MSRTIVLFTPLPPARSGISAYCAELLPALRERARVVVVTADDQPAPEVAEFGVSLSDLEVMRISEFRRSPSLRDLPRFHQIGNNADHAFVYDAFLESPDILVQHDFNLHYLLEDASLARADPSRYEAVLQEEYGDAGATLARLRGLGYFADTLKLRMPVNTHLIARARRVIVHNHWVWQRVPDEHRAKVRVAPHHYSPLADAYRGASRPRLRAKLGLPAGVPIVLSLGFITPPKQIQSTLKALSLLKAAGTGFLFVIAGERNPSFDIDRHIDEAGLRDDVQITGYVSERDFFEYIVASDVLVNLRHPTVGESSGTLARALALGLPAIVYDFGPFSEFPDAIVSKVPHERGRPVRLAHAIQQLIDSPELRTRMGRLAVAHMASHCSVGSLADMYLATATE